MIQSQIFSFFGLLSETTSDDEGSMMFTSSLLTMPDSMLMMAQSKLTELLKEKLVMGRKPALMYSKTPSLALKGGYMMVK